MWYQRDQFSNLQLPVSDRQLITRQNEIRVHNHAHSERSKAPHGNITPSPVIDVGDLIYLYVDRNISSARYLVVSVERAWCNIKKFRGSQLRNTSYPVSVTNVTRYPLLSPPAANNPSNDEQEDHSPPRLQLWSSPGRSQPHLI